VIMGVGTGVSMTHDSLASTAGRGVRMEVIVTAKRRTCCVILGRGGRGEWSQGLVAGTSRGDDTRVAGWRSSGTWSLDRKRTSRGVARLAGPTHVRC